MKPLSKFSIALLLAGFGFGTPAAKAQVVSAPILEGQSFVQTGLQKVLKGLEARANTLIRDGVQEQALTKQFTSQNMQMHKQWYDGLMQVSSTVRNYQRVAHIFNRQAAIITIYSDYIERFRADPNLTPAQLAATTRGYTALINQSADYLDELRTIISPAKAKMTDAERMELIDKLDDKVTEQYNLVNYFTRRTMAISAQQAQTTQDRKTRLALYNRPN